MIRTIIIDDEPSAVSTLATMLQKKCSDDIELIATTTNPQEGIYLIEQHQPSLVFCDIEMPFISGIDLVRHFKTPSFRVIFCTAYDTYAVEAFRVNAIDYLLKPMNPIHVVDAIEKIKNDINKNGNVLSDQLKKLEKLFNPQKEQEDKIGISLADKIVFVNRKEITFCEAKGHYTTIYLSNGSKILASKPLGDFENQLDWKSFFRIHHSTLINLDHVKEFQKHDGGYVIMQNNTKLEVSQRKRKDFLDAIHDFVV